MNQQITKICSHFVAELDEAIGAVRAENIFILTDSNTQTYCLPALMQSEKLQGSNLINIANGDEHKHIDSAILIWKYLSEHGATRKSLMINVGGGMITDIGGFTAATFKRGIPYINVSTSLLGAVDAATGGKTGINFGGLKNEIGVFAPAKEVLINIDFFKTLTYENLISGFAEMMKHALIDSTHEWKQVMAFDAKKFDLGALKPLLINSFRIKERIVAQDPHEANIRKALNLGHTIGHAFESYSYKAMHPVLHGYAVMWGMLCELHLSQVKLGFPDDVLQTLVQFTKAHYGVYLFENKDYDTLFELMTHDKKNDSKEINFTLLSAVGEIKINQTATKAEIYESLDWFRKI
ncbi:MAG: 3-dehydroquinate synthase [Porphyromonadaceae bacterium CG2_30_38_12]|nr:MAG: 3-dehydroquinate synthase [Porphyromonadaceae bacterium CG2_30_38_12]